MWSASILTYTGFSVEPELNRERPKRILQGDKMASYTISLTASGPSPNGQTYNPGDKITWTNNASTPVIAFNLPTCVAGPPLTLPLIAGASTSAYNVNKSPKGSYGYNYTLGPTGDPISGTIDVS